MDSSDFEEDSGNYDFDIIDEINGVNELTFQASAGDTSEQTGNPEDTVNSESRSKEEVIEKVKRYHFEIGRRFKVVRNDHRRYSVVCKEKDCPFELYYAFKKAPLLPRTFIRHTCQEIHFDAENPLQPSVIAGLSGPAAWVLAQGPNAKALPFMEHLRTININVSYSTAYRALASAKKRIFKQETNANNLAPWELYTNSLTARGHLGHLEADGPSFKRLFVLYAEGTQSQAIFKNRGIQVDATLLGCRPPGTLLVASFIDSNNNQVILAVAVVDASSHENWDWFLGYLSIYIATPPFVISDRAPALITSVTAHFKDSHHAYCLQRIMDDFSTLFDDKNLAKIVWSLAKATSEQAYQQRLETLNSTPNGEKAFHWLDAIGLDKFTLYKSPVVRFGILTVTKNESINSRIAGYLEHPTLDLLYSIEKLVSQDKDRRFANCLENWGQILTTLHAHKLLEHNKRSSLDFAASPQDSPDHYVVFEPTGNEFDVNTATNECPCGYPKQFLLPCKHLIYAYKLKKQPLVTAVSPCWLKSTYLRAYAKFFNSQSITAKRKLRLSLAAEQEGIPPLAKSTRLEPRGGLPEPPNSPLLATAGTEANTRAGASNAPSSRRTNTCSLCKKTGHNLRKCPLNPKNTNKLPGLIHNPNPTSDPNVTQGQSPKKAQTGTSAGTQLTLPPLIS